MDVNEILDSQWTKVSVHRPQSEYKTHVLRPLLTVTSALTTTIKVDGKMVEHHPTLQIEYCTGHARMQRQLAEVLSAKATTIRELTAILDNHSIECQKFCNLCGDCSRGSKTNPASIGHPSQVYTTI